MRTKLLTALIGVTLCLAFASNPNPVLAEKESADLRPSASLRQRIDANGDGTIDADEKAGSRRKYLKRFDRNNDGKLDRNERRHARRRFDRPRPDSGRRHGDSAHRPAAFCRPCRPMTSAPGPLRPSAPHRRLVAGGPERALRLSGAATPRRPPPSGPIVRSSRSTAHCSARR